LSPDICRRNGRSGAGHDSWGDDVIYCFGHECSGNISIIDLYKRHARTEASAEHYLWASRLAALAWGCYAVISAQYVKRMGSLIEAVNLLGSFFYGGMLAFSFWLSSSGK